MNWPWLRSRRDRELDEELRSHLIQSIQSRLAAGETREEAERAARLEFGNVTHVREVTREMWGWSFVDRLTQDVRDALRSIRRSPGVATATVLSLALGIGANTSIFRVMNALMLRSLPVASPGGLYTIVPAEIAPGSWGGWPYFYFEQFRDRMPEMSLAATAVSHRSFVMVEGAGGGTREPRPVAVTMVSGNYFATLGLAPQLGRLIAPPDDAAGSQNAVVVISDAYWTSRFGRAADVLGRRVSISGTSFEVIGVAPRGFSGDVVGDPTPLWVPIALQSEVVPELPGQILNDWQTGWAWVRMIGRLRPGVTPEAASRAATETEHAFIREQYPSSRPDTRQVVVRPAGGGESPAQKTLAQPVIILMAGVGLVLLIACANVANLYMARGFAREREFAVRAALGASRTRLVRQLLIESLLMSSVGTALGVAVSSWTTALLMPLVSAGDEYGVLDVSLDRHVFLFAAALAAATGVTFGLLPAWRATRVRVTLITGHGRSTLAMASNRHAGLSRSSRGLLVMQVAMAFALLVGAQLLAATLGGLRAVDPGVDREHVLLVWTGGSNAPGSSATTIERYRVAQEKLSALPGVVSASPAMAGVLNDSQFSIPSDDLTVDEVPVKPGLRWVHSTVGPRFFSTLGASLLAGRDFTTADASGSTRVAILDETMARFLFGAASPLGRHIRDVNCRNCVTVEIIGVASNMAFASPRQASMGVVYLPYLQQQFRSDSPMFVAVRTVGDPTAQAAAVRRTIQTFAPDVPVLRIETVDARLNTLLSTDRMMALLGGGFGVFALLLAGVGLYGIVSYAVIRRTSEIGVRLALGASRARILAMVVGSHAVLVTSGLVLGWLLARLGTQFISSRLYGIDARDPSSYISAIVGLLAIAIVATLMPAWRASHLDPASTLRSE